MIRKSVQRFSEKIMLQQKNRRDDASKKRHQALVVPTVMPSVMMAMAVVPAIVMAVTMDQEDVGWCA